MTNLKLFLADSIIWMEFLSAFVGICYFNSLKNSYWKWFVFYLIFIFTTELFSTFVLVDFQEYKKSFYGYFVVPIEFIFYYWLYGVKSLKKIKLFVVCVFTYLISFIPYLIFKDNTLLLNPLNYTVGVFLLGILIYLEFINQIKSDNILNFKSNKMFYINMAVFIFYIGTLPLFTFYKYLYENERIIFKNYQTFFLIIDNLMYLLFTASFIWGEKSKT